jgi:hypothetical protein
VIWAFIVVFPLLLGAPVTALMVAQLEAHKSNATVSVCTIGAATVVLPE